MCRIAILPPKTTKREALSILNNFLNENTDGTGECHIEQGKLVVNKYALSLDKVIKKKKDFLSHLPSESVTMVHLRAASFGEKSKQNSHPFLIENGKKSFCLIHNGSWHSYDAARLALSNLIKFKGQTDSETAAEVINICGIKKFSDEINSAGVFAILMATGEVYVIKTSGELSLVRRKGGKMLIASELDFKKYPKQLEALTGYYKFSPKLKYLYHREKKSQFAWTPASPKATTAYEESFGGKHDASPTVTTWIHNKKTGLIERKVETLKSFREIGAASESQGYFGGHGWHGMD